MGRSLLHQCDLGCDLAVIWRRGLITISHGIFWSVLRPQYPCRAGSPPRRSAPPPRCSFSRLSASSMWPADCCCRATLGPGTCACSPCRSRRRCSATTERAVGVALAGSWIEGQPSGCPARAFPHGRPRQSPGRPERSGGSAEQVDSRGRRCAARRREPPGAHAPGARAARRRPHRQRVRTGTAPRRSSVRGARGWNPSPAQCTHIG